MSEVWSLVLELFLGHSSYYPVFYWHRMTYTLIMDKKLRPLFYLAYKTLRDKMATIFQKTFSNAVSWMKIFEFHGRLFQGSNQQYSSIGSDNGLVPTRRQAIIWTNYGFFTDVHMRPNGLTKQALEVGNGWVITSHRFTLICFFIYVLIQMKLCIFLGIKQAPGYCLLIPRFVHFSTKAIRREVWLTISR